MKKLLPFLIFFLPSVSSACMPPFPSEIMIGRVDSLEKTTSGIIDIGFSSYTFPFRDFTYEAPTSWKYRSNDDYAISHVFPDDIQVDSLIIALSDTPDGRLPQDYSVFHIATLNCKNNILSLGKKDGKIIGWNRKEGSCRYEATSLLDVFTQGDERVWINSLQKKYPNCEVLQKSFPSMSQVLTGSMNSMTSKNTEIPSVHALWNWLERITTKISTFLRGFLN